MNRFELQPGDIIMSPTRRLVKVTLTFLKEASDEYLAKCSGVPVKVLIDRYFERNSAGYVIPDSAYLHIISYGGLWWVEDVAIKVLFWHQLRRVLQLMRKDIKLLNKEK